MVARRLLVWSIVVGCLALLVGGAEYLRRQDPLSRMAGTPIDPKSAIRLKNVEATLRKGMTPLAHVSVDQIVMDQDRSQWQISGVKNAEFLEEGKPFAIATCQNMLYSAHGQTATLKGKADLKLPGVKAIRGEAIALQTEQAVWDIRGRLLTTSHSMSLAWSTGRAIAQAMRVNLADKTLELEDVTATLTAQPPKKSREVIFRYKKSRTAKNKTRAENVEIVDQDAFMRADIVDYDETDDRRYVLATGGLLYIDARIDATAGKLETWLNDERALLTEGVVLIIKEKKSEIPDQSPPKDEEALRPENIRKYPIYVTCDRLESFYEEERAILTGNLKVEQRLPDGKFRTATAERAEFDAKNEVLTLIGKVLLEDEKGQSFEAAKIALSVKEGEEWYEATDVTHGRIKIEKKEQP